MYVVSQSKCVLKAKCKANCTNSRNALPLMGRLLYFPARFLQSQRTESLTMALEIQPGGNVRVTIQKTVNRESARRTLERLFMKDKAVAEPIESRSANFKELPKRRGGCIWTKRPNKVHLELARGTSAVVKATPQHIQDLKSVSGFVEVAKA